MKSLKIILCMVIAFAIGGTISYVLFSKQAKEQFANPEQFRTPQLASNQTLQPSFDPGVIAGTKPFAASPNASAAKKIEAGLGKAVVAGKAPANNGTKAHAAKPKPKTNGSAAQTPSQPAPQPSKPKQSLSDIRDELM